MVDGMTPGLKLRDLLLNFNSSVKCQELSKGDYIWINEVSSNSISIQWSWLKVLFPPCYPSPDCYFTVIWKKDPPFTDQFSSGYDLNRRGCQALQELSLANFFNFMVHCVKMATIFQFSLYTSVTLFAMYFFGLFLSRSKVYFLSPWIQAGLLSCFDIYSAMEFCRGMVCQFWGLKGMAVSVLSGTLCSCQVGLAFWEMRDHKEQSSQLKCPTWGPRHLRGPG